MVPQTGKERVAPLALLKSCKEYGLSLFEYAGRLSVPIFLVVFLTIITFPSLARSLGDVFFGRVKPLYNTHVAEFLYRQSAYPMLPGMQAAPYAHYQLSRVYFIQGSLYASLDEAQLELRTYPDHTQTYYILGLTYGYLGRTADAIDAFTKYIETHPNTWAGRNDKAWLQFRTGDIAGATETIEPVARNFKYTPWVQNTYCALLINQDRLTEAEEACINAKVAIDKMTEEDWGHAYPGNSPQIYKNGLESMKESIGKNLYLLTQKQ